MHCFTSTPTQLTHSTLAHPAPLRGLQSEDQSVVVWRCDDWSVVAVVRAPYTKLVTSTFSTRMSWSPDGSFLATGVACRGLRLQLQLHCL